jgi:hypothetical protein
MATAANHNKRFLDLTQRAQGMLLHAPRPTGRPSDGWGKRSFGGGGGDGTDTPRYVPYEPWSPADDETEVDDADTDAGTGGRAAVPASVSYGLRRPTLPPPTSLSRQQTLPEPSQPTSTRHRKVCFRARTEAPGNRFAAMERMDVRPRGDRSGRPDI